MSIAAEVIVKLIDMSKTGELGKVAQKWADDRGLKGKMSDKNKRELIKYLSDYIVDNRKKIQYRKLR